MQALPAQALSFDQWMCMLSCFGCVRLFATLWIVACQTPLSVEFSRQEYWSGLSCPPPWHLLDPGIELLLHLLLWQMGSFTTSTSWEAHPVNALVKIKPMSRYTISSMEERRFSSATLFIFCSWFSLLLVSYYHSLLFITVQFSSVAQLCPTLCDPMNWSMPGLPVHHQLPEFTQTHVHWVSDAI